MTIGSINSVDQAALRPAPAHTPVSPTQRVTQDSPVFPAAQPVTQEAVAAAVQSANAYVQSASTNIQFSLDQESGKTIVKLVDSATDEVIRQFPSEEMLAISASIDRMQGLLINREA